MAPQEAMVQEEALAEEILALQGVLVQAAQEVLEEQALAPRGVLVQEEALAEEILALQGVLAQAVQGILEEQALAPWEALAQAAQEVLLEQLQVLVAPAIKTIMYNQGSVLEAIKVVQEQLQVGVETAQAEQVLVQQEAMAQAVQEVPVEQLQVLVAPVIKIIMCNQESALEAVKITVPVQEMLALRLQLEMAILM